MAGGRAEEARMAWAAATASVTATAQQEPGRYTPSRNGQRKTWETSPTPWGQVATWTCDGSGDVAGSFRKKLFEATLKNMEKISLHT